MHHLVQRVNHAELSYSQVERVPVLRLQVPVSHLAAFWLGSALWRATLPVWVDDP